MKYVRVLLIVLLFPWSLLYLLAKKRKEQEGEEE